MSGKGRDREEGRVTVVLGGGCDCLDASMHENPQQFCLALQVGCSWLSGSVVAAETHLCRAQSAVVYPISVCLHVLGALDAPLGSASSPVADLRQACPPLEVAHKQVLHSTVGAARQQHGNGLPVVAVAGLRLQAEGGGGGGAHAHAHVVVLLFSAVAVACCQLQVAAAPSCAWHGRQQLVGPVTTAVVAAAVALLLQPCRHCSGFSHQHNHCDFPLCEGALAGVFNVWAEEVAPPAVTRQKYLRQDPCMQASCRVTVHAATSRLAVHSGSTACPLPGTHNAGSLRCCRTLRCCCASAAARCLVVCCGCWSLLLLEYAAEAHTHLSLQLLLLLPGTS